MVDVPPPLPVREESMNIPFVMIELLFKILISLADQQDAKESTFWEVLPNGTISIPHRRLQNIPTGSPYLNASLNCFNFLWLARLPGCRFILKPITSRRYSHRVTSIFSFRREVHRLKPEPVRIPSGVSLKNEALH
jgi:hypothetical protein